MSLIRCPECKKKISDQADYCPHCGCPIKRITDEEWQRMSTEKELKRRKKSKRIALTTFSTIVFGIVCFAAWLSSISKEAELDARGWGEAQLRHPINSYLLPVNSTPWLDIELNSPEDASIAIAMIDAAETVYDREALRASYSSILDSLTNCTDEIGYNPIQISVNSVDKLGYITRNCYLARKKRAAKMPQYDVKSISNNDVIAIIPKFTLVKIIDVGPKYCYVIVDSGKYKDKYGYVDREVLRERFTTK